MKIKSKLLMAFSAIVTLTIILGIISYNNANRVGAEFTFLVEHDLNVLQNAQHLQKLVVDADTGQRGYIITGDNNFLQPYYSGVSQFEALIEVEKKLVSDDPSQVQKLETISKLFDEWQTKAAIPEIELARTVHQSLIVPHDLETILSEGTGKGIHDQMRLSLDELLTFEIEDGNKDTQIVIKEIIKDLVDRESAQRGFLITGENEFLEQYYLGNDHVVEHFAELKLLLELDDEPEDLVLVDKMMRLSDEWLEKAAIPEIEARKRIDENPDIHDVAILLQAGAGKSILDQIRAEFKEFIEIENDLKDQRFLQVLGIESDTKSYVVGIIITISGFASMIGFLMYRSISIPIAKLTTGSDLLARGKLEKEIVISGNDELTDLTKAFNKMAISLKQSKKTLQEKFLELQKMDVLKEEFTAMVSHELNSPLTPILGWCGALMEPKYLGELTKKQTHAINTIHTNASRLSKLVSDVLDVQKLDMKKMTFERREFNVKDMINELESDFHYITKDIDFVTSSPTNLVLKSDKRRIQQVITNIVNNALNFIPKENGKITLTATEVDHSVLFSVKDNGSGIPDDEKKNLFQKFYQIDTSSTRKHRGTGLGLTICKGIVEGLRGKIWIESENGKGSSFYFAIPKEVIKEE